VGGWRAWAGGWGWGWGGAAGGDRVRAGADLLHSLNTDLSLDAEFALNRYIADDENVSQFFQTHIKSDYHDLDSFIASFKHTNEPIILSLNIQSLNSKYEALKSFVRTLLSSEIPLDIIVLQETWELRFPNLLIIPGFQRIAYRTRDKGRGGGVGIFVRDGLNFKERPDLENYMLKTFENIVLEIQYPGKSCIISNIYRSPNLPPPLSNTDHVESFLNTFDNHLSKLSDLNCNTYVLLDSNINLLRLHESPLCSAYLDTALTNGFLQIISKATRIQNNKASLIDHIFSNSNLPSYSAGTIIDDLSDHFCNFIQLGKLKAKKQNVKESTKRLINEANTNNLKMHLITLTGHMCSPITMQTLALTNSGTLSMLFTIFTFLLLELSLIKISIG
jgi:hypothetical protein